MDLESNNHQESNSTVPSPSHPPPTTTPAPVRFSARVKAAKQKEQAKLKEKEQEQSASADFSVADSGSHRVTRSTYNSTSRNKRPREVNTGKGKAVETSTERLAKRPRRPANSSTASLTIDEPQRQPKGKERQVDLEDEDITASSSSRSIQHSTNYTLRSRAGNSSNMPKKARSSASKGRPNTTRSKAPASSKIMQDEDVDMIGVHDNSDIEVSADELMDEEVGSDEDRDEIDETPIEGARNHDEDRGEGESGNNTMASSASGRGPMDDSNVFAFFGDYRQLGSYMMSLSTRLKSMLNNIKATADPTTRLVTLQELSELLSISTEDTLAGSFPVEQFVRELVRILGGSSADEEDGDEDREDIEQSEEAALAAVLSLSTGNSYQGDDNLEAQVLACRCLANLMEALPGVAHTVVYHGAIPVLCSKLIEISYIDLAEQTLSTMEKISEEFPSSIVREGGLAALLGYLDFFSIAVQRTALQAASNCCRNVSPEHFGMIRGVWPTIRNCLSYSDQRLVEFACLCVIRVVESYHRSSIENLESLVDVDLIRAINQLLLPAGGSPLIASGTYTLLLRALATSTRASPKVMITLLKAEIVETLFQILTGVLPPCEASEEQGGSSTGQGIGGGVADMTVMDNLAHRPKDQVEEALSLVSELMPPLPRDGVFDHKSYTEKALSRLNKAKTKADRAAARQVLQAGLVSAALIAPPSVPAEETSNTPSRVETPPQEGDDTLSQLPRDSASDRSDLLRSDAKVAGRFMRLMVPILIDVYAASVSTPMRVKCLTGVLKAVSFLDENDLSVVFKFVPIASFTSSILSSKDHPSLVIGALQLADLLLGKAPAVYKPTFKREGVFHEIQALAIRDVASSKKDKEKGQSAVPSSSESATPTASQPALIPGFKKLTSLSLEPDDAITLRARVIQFKYLANQAHPESDSVSESLRRIVQQLSSPKTREKELVEALKELAKLFASPHTSVSSFELLQSGLVDSLLHFATDGTCELGVLRRKELLLEALTSLQQSAGKRATVSPFATFVKKLQECLTRMESFDVTTVAQNTDDSKRSSPSLLARQLRLRLVADEDPEIPQNLHNIVVSIHAIATFQALHDYLRPRVSGLFSDGPRLSGMLAALAASGFPASTSRPPSAIPSVPTAATDPAPDTSASSISPPISRRRSQRLGNKSGASQTSAVDAGVGDSTENAATSSEAAPAVDSTPMMALPIQGSEGQLFDPQMAADFTDEEMDHELFEDDIATSSERTVSVSVVEDGSKVVAQTPDGTRVATPGISTAITRPTATAKASYAAALKTKPTDWHLEFSMDDQPLPLDLTIYGAIHQSEMRKKSNALPPSLIWQGIYTVKFKKVTGPAPLTDSRDGTETGFKSRSNSPVLSSLPPDAPHTRILNLLRLLHRLNVFESEQMVSLARLPDTAFINNKLTAKLTRQLEEPMIVASSCLPDWALDLPQHFPFLFPFTTRYNFLQSTSFGYARLILKWQIQQSRGQDHSRRDDGIGFLGRLQRQKVRISRKHILESAVKVFELYGSSSSVLEVEYFEEVGTGLGPTLEFYSLVSKEFVRKDLKIWRDADISRSGSYVFHPQGLYPTPISPDDIASDGGHKRTHLLRVVGQFVAKAMLDSRIIDLSFNKLFMRHVLGEDVPVTITVLRLVDAGLADSLVKLQSLAAQQSKGNKSDIIDDLAIDFTLPGYDIELRVDGKETQVTAQNVDEYIKEVLNATIGDGVRLQAKAFREGFSKVFPISDLQAFSADELVMLFGNAEEDWSIETFAEAVKADHGFNADSRAIRCLIEIMSEFDVKTRREYLQFITGSPKLPIGGFRGLNPPLTVVRKPHEAPLTADDYLPSVMTCVNYLKLPEYSTKEVMREKLRIAMQEGMGSFHLS